MTKHTGTYFGSRAEVTDTPNSNGTRSVRIVWLDDADPRNGGHPAGTIVERVVSGNWRTGITIHEEEIHRA